MQPPKPRTRWTLAIVSLALFMVVLDNLIVTVALPSIRRGPRRHAPAARVDRERLHARLRGHPDPRRRDRRPLRPQADVPRRARPLHRLLRRRGPRAGRPELVAARALQGIGGAIVAPLTLTLLAEAFPPERRGAALGIWSGISGLGIALGPLVGGAVVSGLSWQWIFWINVPLGVALLPLAAVFLRESRGEATRLDLPGVGLVTTGLFALVFGLVRGQGDGWTSPLIVGSLSAGAVLLALFVAHERRTEAPMVPLDLFAKRAFAVTNAVSFFMYFGTFGSIFLITQFVQQVMGYAPFDAGVRMLVWTGATAITSPIAGILAERRGPRTLMALGLTLQAAALAWLAMASGVDSTNSELAAPFAIAGIGMGLVFAPSASALLSVVAPHRAGQASGTNNAIREVGGVFGVAVMSTIFSGAGGFTSPQAFVDGFHPALWVGAAVVGVGAAVALLLPAGREEAVTADTVEAGAHTAPLAAAA